MLPLGSNCSIFISAKFSVHSKLLTVSFGILPPSCDLRNHICEAFDLFLRLFLITQVLLSKHNINLAITLCSTNRSSFIINILYCFLTYSFYQTFIHSFFYNCVQFIIYTDWVFQPILIPGLLELDHPHLQWSASPFSSFWMVTRIQSVGIFKICPYSLIFLVQIEYIQFLPNILIPPLVYSSIARYRSQNLFLAASVCYSLPLVRVDTATILQNVLLFPVGFLEHLIGKVFWITSV